MGDGRLGVSRADVRKEAKLGVVLSVSKEETAREQADSGGAFWSHRCDTQLNRLNRFLTF